MNMIVGHCHGRSPLQQLKSQKLQALNSVHRPIRSELFCNIFFEASATAVMILLRDSVFLVLSISVVFPFGAFLGYLQPIFSLCSLSNNEKSFLAILNTFFIIILNYH